MLCSSICSNDNFGKWLLSNAYFGPDRVVVNSDETLFNYLQSTKANKPYLLMLDEIQMIYNAEYAHSFWETVKRIMQEDCSKWNIKVDMQSFYDYKGNNCCWSV
jgi:hypothetical protein